MKYLELEQELRARIKKRRMIEAVLSLVCLIILIVFAVLYEQSKVVEEIEWGPITHQSVTYNTDFLWGIMVGACGFVISIIFLIADCIFSKLIIFEVKGDYITFYRGMVHTNLYVNGEQKDGITYGYYLEATLSDRTKINVALGKWSAHITFSDGHPSIDV